MLYRETVDPETFKLLVKLQSLASLQNFYLAGGTALSLYYGHRISIDLDLFTHTGFNTETVLHEISEAFSDDNVSIINEDRNSLLLSINDIKVDILSHQYALINPNIKSIDYIKIYAKEDIIAMKLNALANRGTKKDFFDIYEVLQEFTLRDLFNFFETKYTNKDIYYVLRSLIYFEDAALDKDPIMIKKYDWEIVKEFITREVQKF
jgi:predicted nucleotidyltransferase component of viral defense system